jgi:hypothetical protein
MLHATLSDNITKDQTSVCHRQRRTCSDVWLNHHSGVQETTAPVEMQDFDENYDEPSLSRA